MNHINHSFNLSINRSSIHKTNACINERVNDKEYDELFIDFDYLISDVPDRFSAPVFSAAVLRLVLSAS